MLFSEVIGHLTLKKQLRQSVNENRVSHAQLFLGNEGSGNLALALAFAQYINCENSSKEDESCQVCPSCLKASKLIHPDIHFSYPVIPKKSGDKPKSTDFIEQWRNAFLENPYMNVNQWLQFIEAENKQGNITIEECHDIIRKLNLKTFESRYKILILWMPEYLDKAGNTLLKLIEEPPDNTVILLVAQNRDLILNTIISRTQLLKVNSLQDEEIQTALMERKNLLAEESKKISLMSDGNFNEALRLMANPENDFAGYFQRWMEMLLTNNGNDLLKWVDEISKIGRENQKGLLRYGLHFLREMLMVDLQTNNHLRLLKGEFQFAEKLNNQIGFDGLERIIELFNKNHYYIERNANPKILFLNLSLSLSKILQNKTVAL